jgi:hypothetical protein
MNKMLLLLLAIISQISLGVLLNLQFDSPLPGWLIAFPFIILYNYILTSE